MTTLMPQPGLGLTAPSSRQDIISALLNDYGNSFGGETSPYNYSPGALSSKELPPPPPGGDEKPLPPIMMRFQLRVDEPRSPASPFDDPSPIEPPKKIISRSMSRSSKPRSLKLSKSNGSTALVPASPAPPAPAKDIIYSPPVFVEERPPPPPPKSERRKSSMSNVAPKSERRDSKEPQGEEPLPPMPPMKRKPVPVAKGFVSLADLGSGPRGRKPVASQEGSRRPSVARSDNQSPARKAMDGIRPTVSLTEVPKVSEKIINVQKEEAPKVIEKVNIQKPEAPLPPPPRKAMGLPSNPRARSQEGKSSTGLDLMKATKTTSKSAAPTPTLATVPSPAPARRPVPSPAAITIPAPAPVMSSITPGPTPSPRKTEAIQTGAAVQGPTLASTIQAALLQSPVSPISTDSDGRRPFSFEGSRQPPPPPPQQQQQQSSTRPTPPPKQPDSPVSPPTGASFAQFPPPRTTSRPTTSKQQVQTQQVQQQQPRTYTRTRTPSPHHRPPNPNPNPQQQSHTSSPQPPPQPSSP